MVLLALVMERGILVKVPYYPIVCTNEIMPFPDRLGFLNKLYCEPCKVAAYLAG